MRSKYIVGITIALMMVTQTLCQDVYIDPALASIPLLDCTSNCTQQAPCGIPANFTITRHCDIYIGNGWWFDSLVIQTRDVISQNVHYWDSTGTGDYIRNLAFEFIGGANSQLRLFSWNATGTSLGVSSNFFGIYNSTLINVRIGIDSPNVGSYTQFEMVGTSLIKYAGPIETIGLQNTGSVTIEDSTITMLSGFDFTSGTADVITIRRSTLNARVLFYQAITILEISDSHLAAASLASLPPLYFSSTNTSFTGSRLQNAPWFGSASPRMTEFKTLFCNYTSIRFIGPLLQQFASVVAIGNIFTDFRVSFTLLSPTLSVPLHFENNTFVRHTTDYPLLELTGHAAYIYLSGNQFENRYTGPIDSSSVVVGGHLTVNSASNLVTDGLCVMDSRFDGSLNASFVEFYPGIPRSFLNITGNAKLSSFTSAGMFAFSKNRLHYSITNASQGIDAPTAEIPRVLHLSWEDPNHPLTVGDSWPVFTKADYRAALPTTLSTDGSFTYNISSKCSGIPSTCMVNFTILSFTCPCNPQHSEPCGNPFVYPCTCVAPWTGPTCDIKSSSPTSNPSCPTPQPGPGFVCRNGTWSSNTSITQDTLNIPSNSGTIVVNGNLTITQTVIFQGLGSLINVTGCIFVDGGVVVELTDHDIEEIRKGSKTFILMSSVDGNDCESSNDLSLIPINVKTPDKCVKVDAVNSGTKQSLSAIFTISESKCSSSHLVAILVPSIVGGVIILSAVAIIVFLKIRHAKTHH